MSFFLLGWLWSSVRRLLRLRGSKAAPRSGSPEWPLGASICLCLHWLRFEADEFEQKPPTVRFTITRDADSGILLDQNGRELVSAAIRARQDAGSVWRKSRVLSVPDLRKEPDGILRVLDADILAEQVITLMFADAKEMSASPPFERAGITFVDATCVWIESSSGFVNAHDQAISEEVELAAA